MKAVLIRKVGGPEVLEFVKDQPKPARAAGKVLVKAASAGVNPVDSIIRSGYYPPPLPKVLGGDVAGVVEEADEGSKFKKGDKVFALTPGYFNQDPNGCYAEYVVCDEAWLARVPDNLPLEQAAGVPLAALTAWQAIHGGQHGPGERALVNAAAGGVGHLAVQIAKALGMHVTAVCGTKNVEWVKSHLGADEVLDYSKDDVAAACSDPSKHFDLALDTMGSRSDLLAKLLQVTKGSGHLAHVLNAGTDQKVLDEAKARHAEGKGPLVTVTLVQPNGEQLQKVADLIGAGKVKLEVSLSLPLEQAAKAHEQIETGHTRGKIVLTL